MTRDPVQLSLDDEQHLVDVLADDDWHAWFVSLPVDPWAPAGGTPAVAVRSPHPQPTEERFP